MHSVLPRAAPRLRKHSQTWPGARSGGSFRWPGSCRWWCCGPTCRSPCPGSWKCWSCRRL